MNVADYSLYLSLIEMTCGLLILGSTLVRTPYLEELQKGRGRKFFIMAGLLIIIKEILWLTNIFPTREVMNAIVFILIATGITNFNKYSTKKIIKSKGSRK